MTDDDFAPHDGLCNVFIEFEGFDRRLNSANGDVRFRFVHKEGDHEMVISTISIPTLAGDDGISGAIARAHDDLIDILRQGIWCLDKVRESYRRAAVASSQKT